jgi:hypothetical protein
MELIGVTPHSEIVELELEEVGSLAHLREEPETDEATTRRALDFLAAVRWLPVMWGRLTPQEMAESLADAQGLGWPATLARSGITVSTVMNL